jgi:cyclic beta-1,2-glucan synthetase
VAIEGILGLRRRGAAFEVKPCIPSSWPGFSLQWRFGGSSYTIAVENPEALCSGIAIAELDETAVDPEAIPLVDDGAVHHLRIVLGVLNATTKQGATTNARKHARILDL